MRLFMHEHFTVESVEDGVAVCKARIPVDMLDDVLALADHVIHASRWLQTRSRVVLSTQPVKPSSLPDSVLLGAEGVCKVLSISRATFFRMKKAGLLPDPVNIGGQFRWRRTEIERLAA
jgi:predicted DNA-binding transcriptional regulator AlpA